VNIGKPISTTLLCLALLPLPLSAAPEDTREAQRSRFVAAEKALKQGATGRYRTLKSGLQNYPLLPYLEYRELRGRLSKARDSEVEKFLKQYSDTPLALRMRRAQLDRLASRGAWKRYLDFYQPDINVRRQCHYLNALIKTGEKDSALAQVEPLWLHGDSRPEACDPVFKTWREAGKLTPELTWQRIDLAMERGKTGLARYLRRFLPKQERKWFDQWQRLHNKPARVATTNKLDVPAPQQQKILAHAVQRLARKDGEKARSAWHRLSQLTPFSSTQKARVEHALALAMIREGHPNVLGYLDGIKPEADNRRLLEARIRVALSNRDWPRLTRWISELPEELRKEESWRYWRARALAEQGDAEKAKGYFEQLANERSYYGFLAADRLKVDYSFGHQPVMVNQQRFQELTLQPGIARAQELYALGRLIDARREWEASIRDLDTESLQTAAKLAHNMTWHDRTIMALARAKSWHDLELRFPLEHRDNIASRAKERQLDSAWVFAVIRQESAFIRDAHSRVGAMGLMQLMPRTARHVARNLKRRAPSRSELLKPETNIDLGTAYLRQVMDQLNGNHVLATAAYNAGPHRVRAWLPEQTTDADLWVELVPFRETRKYLKRVLTYSVIYRKRLGLEPQRLADTMPPIQPVDTRTSGLIDSATGDKPGAS
jgi:soluble lytic murein transglycosylase